MTTTEILRAMLDECEVEWEAFDVFEQTTQWSTHNGAFVYWARVRDGKLLVETTAPTKCSASCTPEQAIAATLGPRITGETSDGYHTFNELYHHRAVLFSVVVRDHRELAWKSKLHHDGTMYDGMFIVGIETPQGQATYHYAIDPYWEMFDCKELERAPEWDGHSPDEAIRRIATLGREAGGLVDDQCPFDDVSLEDSGSRTERTTFQVEKTCPFCGSTATLDAMCIEWPNWWSAAIFCDGGMTDICSCEVIGEGRTEQEAIDHALALWNRREGN